MFSTTHLHPMLVHFPIALVLAGFLAEIVSLLLKNNASFSWISYYLLLLGTLAAIVTYFSGVFFTEEMTGEAGKVLSTHEIMALSTTLVLCITAVLRTINLRKGTKALSVTSFLFYVVATLGVGLTGFLGGSLVYQYMLPL